MGAQAPILGKIKYDLITPCSLAELQHCFCGQSSQRDVMGRFW